MILSKKPHIELLNKDCMLDMVNMKDNEYDLAICDIPYGINFAKTHTGNGWVVRESKDWDKSIPSAEYFNQLFRITKDQIIFGGNYIVQYLPPSMGWIVWDKGQRDFSLADGELIFTSFNRALRVFDHSRAKLNKERWGEHPTEKPVQLYRYLLKNYAKEGDKIFDSHCGSGSILIACHEMGFDIRAYEIDKEYYQDCIKRFNLVTSQLKLKFLS